MEWFESNRQTRIFNKNTRSGLSIHRSLSRTGPIQPHNNSKDYHYRKRHRYNKYFHTIKKLCLLLATSVIATPAYAADVGGVSATANPIANSSGSVTNQAIQVLQGPYITNTYGGGIQCQGPTLNMTPYITGTGAFKRPFESYYDDPVYDVHDADDDGQIDNPGDVLYYMPTRTNQTDNYNLSIGVSATWSKPLDKELQALCKEASTTQISLQKQLVANKRLDFEIARLKNCGELMKQGIMFHRKSPYYKVCADVVLVNPAGVVAQHTHQIKPQPQPEPEPVATGTAEDLGTHSVGTTSSPSSKVSSSSQNSQEVNPSSSDTHSSEVQIESADKESSQGWFGSWSWPFSRRASQPSSEDQPAALLGGPIQLPPSQSPQ